MYVDTQREIVGHSQKRKKPEIYREHSLTSCPTTGNTIAKLKKSRELLEAKEKKEGKTRAVKEKDPSTLGKNLANSIS